jgi:uncharacterized protein YbjQ (UPF0145 family)
MLITTNEHFQDQRIEEYLGQVNEQIVVGANIFKDVFASFRDVFGGQTKGYKKELSKLKEAALQGLANNAKELKANAVIGLRMDIDELSGGGKSMFMLNVFGTAVSFKESATDKETSDDKKVISSDELNFQIKRSRLQKRIESGELPFKDILVSKLIEYKVFGVLPEVINNFKLAHQEEELKEYIYAVPAEEIQDYLSKNIQEIGVDNWNRILLALEDKDWFDIDFMLELMSSEDAVIRFRGLKLTTLEKEFYKKTEMDDFDKLVSFLKNNLDTEIEKIVKEGTFKSTEYWKCPRCLSSTKMDYKKCDNCGANRYGLKGRSLEEHITYLSQKFEILKQYFT